MFHWDIYQILPIAHLRPDFQAFCSWLECGNMTCNKPVHQHNTVEKSMKGRIDETCQRPTRVCKQKLRPKEMQAVQSRDECYEDTQWRNPKGKQLGQNSHSICRLFNAPFNSDLHNSKCVYKHQLLYCQVDRVWYSVWLSRVSGVAPFMQFMQWHWQCAVYAELQLISVSSMWHLAGQSHLPNPSFPEIDFSSSR